MMSKEYVQKENVNLLMEIFNLKTILSKLYAQSGPNSSEYISFSCQLNFLVQEYMEEKMILLQDQLIGTRNNTGVQMKEMMEI